MGLPVSLPDAEHSHFDTVLNQFVTHEHFHAGTHRHRSSADFGRQYVENTPGNYSPRAAH